jgi:hypothetical protein
VVELRGYRATLAGVQESHGRGAKEPLVEVASVEIGPNVTHIDWDLSNGMCGIDKHLIYALLAADGDEFLDRNDNTGHGSDVVNYREADPATTSLGNGERSTELGNNGVG